MVSRTQVSVFEISPAKIVERAEFPDAGDDNFVFEHLTRYCSKFTPLPAITAKLDSDELIVTEGHKYLRIACQLGRETIRTILFGCTEGDLQNAGISAKLIPMEELHAEQAVSTIQEAWHVIFVRRELDEAEVADVEEHVREFVESFVSSQYKIENAFKRCNYDSKSRCFEFRFVSPTNDKQWADGFLRLLVEVSQRIGGIDSYQGRRFTHTLHTIPRPF